MVKISTYSPTRKPKNIFNVIFTHYNDIFSKNKRRDNPYGVTLSKISTYSDQIFERGTP